MLKKIIVFDGYVKVLVYKKSKSLYGWEASANSGKDMKRKQRDRCKTKRIFFQFNNLQEFTGVIHCNPLYTPGLFRKLVCGRTRVLCGNRLIRK